jgi:hypothetical protein
MKLSMKVLDYDLMGRTNKEKDFKSIELSKEQNDSLRKFVTELINDRALDRTILQKRKRLSESSSENESCQYITSGISCSSIIGHDHIYCDYHLKLVSKEHRRRKELKLSKSSSDETVIDYSAIFE